jgi:hypothetical protein
MSDRAFEHASATRGVRGSFDGDDPIPGSVPPRHASVGIVVQAHRSNDGVWSAPTLLLEDPIGANWSPAELGRFCVAALALFESYARVFGGGS